MIINYLCKNINIMKYLIIPLIASLMFIITILWTLNYKKAKFEFKEIIFPYKFHTLD